MKFALFINKMRLVLFLLILMISILLLLGKWFDEEIELISDVSVQSNGQIEFKSLEVRTNYSSGLLSSKFTTGTDSRPEVITGQRERLVERGPFAPTEALNVQETFNVDPSMHSIGQYWKTGRKTPNFTMPVSEGRNLEIQVERFESIGEEGGEFTGTVVGAPGSTVNLSYRGSAEAGRIDIPSEGRFYQILPGKDGAIIVQDRNPSLEARADIRFSLSEIKLPPMPDFIPPPPPEGIFEAIPPSKPSPLP